MCILLWKWILSLHVTQGTPVPRNIDLSSPYESDMLSYFFSYSPVDVKFSQTWIVFLQLPVDVKDVSNDKETVYLPIYFLKSLVDKYYISSPCHPSN